MSEVKQTPAALVRLAQRRGAIAAEALVASSDQRSWRTGAAAPERNQASLMAVRVYVDGGGVGEATRGALQAEGHAELVEEALALARKAAPDPLAGPSHRLDIVTRGLGVLDSRQAHLTDPDRAEVLEWNAEGARDLLPDGHTAAFAYRELLDLRAYASSRGVEAAESSTRFGLHGQIFREGLPLLSAENASRTFADIASRPLGVDLARLVEAMGRRASLPEGAPPLVLSPLFVSQLLPEVAMAFDREKVEAGQGFLAGKMGSKIASPLVHILDDGGLPGALATRAFDDRGVPPSVIPLVREGVAHGLYQGVERARQREQRPSGHCALGGGLWLGNLVVRPGTRTRNMIFPELKAFVVVEAAVGRVRFDLQSGEVQATVRAFRGEGQGIIGYCGELLLRCPIEALLLAVVELASDHERHGIVDSPSWVLRGPALSPAP
jgi:predicted Zn-dependent protease